MFVFSTPSQITIMRYISQTKDLKLTTKWPLTGNDTSYGQKVSNGLLQTNHQVDMKLYEIILSANCNL